MVVAMRDAALPLSCIVSCALLCLEEGPLKLIYVYNGIFVKNDPV